MTSRLTPFALATACAILASAPGAAAAADYVSTVTATNPLAYWRLNGNSQPSTNGAYASSYANVTTTATGTGAPILGDPANAAASFDGAGSDSMITTSLSGGIAGRGTINAWIDLAQLPSAAGRTFYIAGESEFGNDFDFQIDTDNALRIYTGSGENTAYSLDASAVGAWVMVTASYDSTLGADSFRNLYVNGTLAAAYTGGVSSGVKSAPFTIGYSAYFGNREFGGAIDEVAVWDRGLTGADISEIYASRLEAAPVGAVPEPATWALMVGGFGLMGSMVRRRRNPTIA